jgi:methyl-accepting chemotaxis protein
VRRVDAIVELGALLVTVSEATGAQRDELVRRITATVDLVRAYGDEVDGGASRMLTATDRIETLVNRLADIAGDAQLLAINAAIEAARAGERGLGFTVIADGIAELSREVGETSEAVIATVVKLRERTGRLRAGSAQQGVALGQVHDLLQRGLRASL